MSNQNPAAADAGETKLDAEPAGGFYLVIERYLSEAQALRYGNEIASDYTYTVIRFLELVLSWFWNKIYDGIKVHNIEGVRDIAQGHEVIYVPCHRSQSRVKAGVFESHSGRFAIILVKNRFRASANVILCGNERGMERPGCRPGRRASPR